MIETNPFELYNLLLPCQCFAEFVPILGTSPTSPYQWISIAVPHRSEKSLPIVQSSSRPSTTNSYLAGFDFEELNSISSKILSSVT